MEGPYGCFDFDGQAPRQVWIAGGVGITPFIARLEALAEGAASAPADLIYSTAEADSEFIDHVRTLAARAGAGFHLLESKREGFLTLERLEGWIPQWREADVWFCGPAGFGRVMSVSMTAAGLPPERFHQELFEMR